ncbi:hypothetical protein [Evansella tamaricis]|uniref:Uncharacterized protein n=1 Tax=Evansella tamaricis TaxID=2069301 RepID=A0ABS6JLD7_9BACI|nr:hypothetical protein [Evansella tamaricis]MBU9713240.1 hypothetical protein [Evansella tamaricis]
MQLNFQQPSEQNDSFILPFSFIITSFFSLLIFAIALAINPTAFSLELIRLPSGLSLAHLFILGWASMLAMGAIYQLIAVVTQRPIYSNRLGFLHYAFYSVGVIGLYISLTGFQLIPMIIFGSLTIIGTLSFIYNVLKTISLSKLNNSVISATRNALLYLGLTVLTGLLMILNFRFSIISFHQPIFLMHLWSGLIGWFLFLIVGYSFKMLPMFYLAHGHSEKWQVWIIRFLHGAIWVSAIAAFFEKALQLSYLSFFLLSLSLVLFILQIKEIQRKRFKKNPGKGITFFVGLVYGLTGASIITFLLAVIQPSLLLNMKFIGAITLFYVLGFVSLSILAYLSKIIPFLWWTFRYGKEVGKGETPSLSEMINETVAERKLWFQLLCLLLFIGALLLELNLLLIIAAILFAFSIVYYLMTIVKAFTI